MMPTYEMQVLMDVGKSVKDWRSIRPTYGQAYQFTTREEAWARLCACYPDAPRDEVRVIEVVRVK